MSDFQEEENKGNDDEGYVYFRITPRGSGDTSMFIEEESGHEKQVFLDPDVHNIIHNFMDQVYEDLQIKTDLEQDLKIKELLLEANRFIN